MTVPADRTLTSFIAGLPKAELHVHHVGSATPEVVATLAERHPDSPVPTDPEQVQQYFAFTDFQHFITTYLTVVDLIRTPEDIRDLTYGVAEGFAADQIKYVELTCTPQTSIVRGIDPVAYGEAIEDARIAAERDLDITIRWIFDIAAESGIPGADTTLDFVKNFNSTATVGFGLGGREIGAPRARFAHHFAEARALGLRSVPHAGESVGPEAVWEAIDQLKAERVEHGIASVHDPILLGALVDRGIVLDICPTSNVATGCVPELAAHPLPALVEAGVTVTINSDDPPMFGTTLSKEYQIAAEMLGLDESGVADLAIAAVDASFTSDQQKSQLRAQISDYLSAWNADSLRA